MSTRQHGRGPHPADTELFAARQVPVLQHATAHLSWLLSHGYAAPSSLKLVGDRFNLVTRQRTAVMRSACADDSLADRSSRSLRANDLAGQRIEIDTFNLLITVEAALSDAVILRGRDGTYRDMASIHGSYRKVDQTAAAIDLIGRFLQSLEVDAVLWRIDRPVSNSGRLRGMLNEYAAERGCNWEMRLDLDPDPVLGEEYDIVVTADAIVLDRVARWANLARWIIDASVKQAWVIAMTDDS